ncbi:metal-binding protein [Haloplanus rubicundus]|uniref:Metal-binding protein n=1 Tax=Haloplanus rubicundus TaxID=1547898 RepID=A0A345E417_9EURY|nr:UPF0058 family protein [Haloplanus rubicundus]AXG06939.1 metal-binding protein [Haloplanus rubicundus]
MRKQELVHLHGLLVEITRSLVDQGTIPESIWAEYEALGINAHSIHARKTDHEEAVLFLATTLSATLERPTAAPSGM